MGSRHLVGGGHGENLSVDIRRDRQRPLVARGDCLAPGGRRAMIAAVNVLGVGVSAVNPASATAEIRRWLDERESHYICVSGVHGVMECQRDPSLKSIHNRAGLVLPDGMPLAWWVRSAGHREADRVCGPEFMPYLLQDLRGRRHFFYGASSETLDKLIA